MMYPTEYSGITLSGIYFHEPGGALTNAILAMWGLILWYRLRNARSAFSSTWRFFILMLSIAALIGIVTHGVPHALGPEWFYIFWSLKNAFIPIANLYGTLAFLSLQAQPSRTIRFAFIAKALLVIWAMMWLYSFTPIAIDLGATYFIVIALALKYRQVLPSGKWFIYAFGLALFSGISYAVKFDLHHHWMTHKDIVHIFALLSMWLIYKGAVETDRAPSVVSE